MVYKLMLAGLTILCLTTGIVIHAYDLGYSRGVEWQRKIEAIDTYLTFHEYGIGLPRGSSMTINEGATLCGYSRWINRELDAFEKTNLGRDPGFREPIQSVRHNVNYPDCLTEHGQ